MSKPVRNSQLDEIRLAAIAVKDATIRQSLGGRKRERSSKHPKVRSLEQARDDLKNAVIAMNKHPLNQFPRQPSIFRWTDRPMVSKVRKQMLRLKDMHEKGEDVTNHVIETGKLLEKFFMSIDPGYSNVKEVGSNEMSDVNQGEKDDAAADGERLEEDEAMAETHDEEKPVQTESASTDTVASSSKTDGKKPAPRS